MRRLLLLLGFMRGFFVTHAQDTVAVAFLNSGVAGYDFGAIAIGENPHLAIPIRNVGNVALRIKSMSSDGGDIKFKASRNIIKPGKAGNIYATYDPADPSVAGSFKDKVSVSFVGIDSIYTFEITGAVVPDNDASGPRNPKGKETSKNPKAAMRKGYDATH